MHNRLIYTGFCIVIALPVLGGCSTTSEKTSLSNHITMNSGAYSSTDTKIGNDIKEILTHGGVDISQAGPALAPVASSPATPKVLSTTATNLETLVAQLSNSSEPLPTLQTSPKSSNTALALASPQKSASDQTHKTEVVFESIQIPTPDTKPVKEKTVKPKQTSQKTSRVTHTAPAASTYKTPRVKRF